jgi:fatty-acyl-CoA synthase
MTLPESLSDLLAEADSGSGPALVDDGIPMRRRELRDASRRVARGLAELGIGAGDRVAIWLPNRAAWLTTFFACAQLGAIAVSINTRFRSAEVGDLLRRSGAKLLIYWPGYKAIDFGAILSQCDAAALAGLETIVLYAEETGALPQSVAGKRVRAFATLLARPAWEEDRGQPDDPCVMFTTSGTTKAPKLVLHSQRRVISHARNVAAQYGLGAATRFLLLPPFCGVYGFCSAMAALVAQTTLVLQPAWNPAEAADLIESRGITHLTASNEAVSQLFEARPATGRLFPSLHFIVAANLNPAHADIVARGEARGVRIVGLYGSSELQALFSLADRNGDTEARARMGGYPAAESARVRARNPASGQLCAIDEAGELEFLAPESRFIEYFNDPVATQNALAEDGYFKSGDLGSVAADGSFTYLARMGDSLRLGGFLVSPAEIEELLQTHECVAGCQIVGITIDGAVKPVAFVIARPNTAVDEGELIAYATQRLAKYKVPVRIFAVAEFPTTGSANGTKVQKHKLREMAALKLGLT